MAVDVILTTILYIHMLIHLGHICQCVAVDVILTTILYIHMLIHLGDMSVCGSICNTNYHIILPHVDTSGSLVKFNLSDWPIKSC